MTPGICRTDRDIHLPAGARKRTPTSRAELAAALTVQKAAPDIGVMPDPPNGGRRTDDRLIRPTTIDWEKLVEGSTRL
jgi:hypothetical protein